MSFVVLVRCANGNVGWIAEPVGQKAAQLKCAADGFTIALSRRADQTWPDAFQQLGAHSVALRGALQQVTVAPSAI